MDEMVCRMYLGKKQYQALSQEGKLLYTCDELGIYTELPALISDGVTLGECVIAMVEAAYLEVNPNYQIGADSKVVCEPYKLGTTEKVFNLLVTIQYAEEDFKTDHHEMLVFQEKELSQNKFSFELVGDQTMFNMNY